MKAKDLRYPYSWEERKPAISQNVLFIPSHYFEHYKWRKIPFFQNDQKIFVELCSGNGEWIVEQAKLHPDINWIGVEMRFDRAAKIWAKASQANLDNLFVVCGEALTFIKFYLMPKCDKLFINFPDPWSKEKHKANRLVQPEFIKALSKVMIARGRLEIATDHTDYANEIENNVGKSSLWKKASSRANLMTSTQNGSFFERLWRSHGKDVHYLAYENRPNTDITVDLCVESNLNFDLAIRQLSEAKGLSDIYIDFGLELSLPRFKDTHRYRTYMLGIKEFSEKVFLCYKDKIANIFLYSGSLNKVEDFIRPQVAQHEYKKWLKEELNLSEEHDEHLKYLFFTNYFSEYLHRLQAGFPEEAPIAVNFDLSNIASPSKAMQLISKERFPHLSIEQYLYAEHARIGICLPMDDKLSTDHYKRIDRIYLQLQKQLRVIPERLITEMWHELDDIIVLTSSVSAYGIRQLQGFCAAGGRVIYVGESLDLMNEISWEKYRGRGI